MAGRSVEKLPALAGIDKKQSAIKRAAALREKYRVDKQPRLLCPALVAQHPQNRGGIAINGSRVDEILRQVLGHFDVEEAAHGAVAVEELPNGSRIRDYNREKTAGDSALAEVPDVYIPYGSLGASHINQVLRNVVFGAKSELVPEVLDLNGRLSLDRVSLVDPAMAGTCSMGLKWDILSHRIEVEEPDGIACIVAALNERASGMMMMHEMEVIKTLARICTTSAATAHEVALDTVRAKLHDQGFSALAESPGLQHLFRFVLEQGCDSAMGSMEPLYAFHEKFVNAKTCRL